MTHKYKALPLKYDLPEELQIEIDKYLDYLNDKGAGAEDCYQTEINVNLNWCHRDKLLPEDIIVMLKNYYVFGGIHKGDQNG